MKRNKIDFFSKLQKIKTTNITINNTRNIKPDFLKSTEIKNNYKK
jgi:hypothetical protein